MDIFKDVFYSSKSFEWSTPKNFYEQLDKEFHFTLDVCASSTNHKCDKYFDINTNGLCQDWSNEICWCNPPYGKDIKLWVYKCALEWLFHGTTVVLLIPANTDTNWFHKYVLPYCEIRFVKGRIHFNDSKLGAPFSSLVCVYNKKNI